MTHHNRTHGYFESQFFGGVLAYTKEQYKKINGFSIEYVNWGQEDDDLYIRTLLTFKKAKKRSPLINRYFCLDHQNATRNTNITYGRNRIIFWRKKVRYESGHISEGLNTTKYTVVDYKKHFMYTKILVDHPEVDDVALKKSLKVEKFY